MYSYFSLSFPKSKQYQGQASNPRKHQEHISTVGKKGSTPQQILSLCRNIFVTINSYLFSGWKLSREAVRCLSGKSTCKQNLWPKIDSPRTHRIEGKNRPQQDMLWSPHVFCGMYVCKYICVHTQDTHTHKMHECIFFKKTAEKMLCGIRSLAIHTLLVWVAQAPRTSSEKSDSRMLTT